MPVVLHLLPPFSAASHSQVVLASELAGSGFDCVLALIPVNSNFLRLARPQVIR